jgi:hypothetical protein
MMPQFGLRSHVVESGGHIVFVTYRFDAQEFNGVLDLRKRHNPNL